MTTRRRMPHGLTVCLGLCAALAGGVLAPGAGGQTEQTVEITIHNYTFVTKQAPLQLNVPTVISIKNEDQVRHDFGSLVFQRTMTRVEHDGVIGYGRGVDGVFLDPGREATIRFTIERPGRYEFRCSIHPDMKGELLLLSAGAV